MPIFQYILYKEGQFEVPLIFQCPAMSIQEADRLFEKEMGFNPLQLPLISCIIVSGIKQ
jgi:hypothetical protein